MNPIYTIMESRQRWLILAGIALTIGSVGAIAIITYNWSHWLARAWFYAGALATLIFLGLAIHQWIVETTERAEAIARAQETERPAETAR